MESRVRSALAQRSAACPGQSTCRNQTCRNQLAKHFRSSSSDSCPSTNQFATFSHSAEYSTEWSHSTADTSCHRSNFQTVLNKRKQRSLDYSGVLAEFEISKRSTTAMQREVRKLRAQLKTRQSVSVVTTTAPVSKSPVKVSKLDTQPINYVEHNKQVLFNVVSETTRAVKDPAWQRHMQQSPRVQRTLKRCWADKPVWLPNAFDWHKANAAVSIKPSFKYCECCNSTGAFISLRPFTRGTAHN